MDTFLDVFGIRVGDAGYAGRGEWHYRRSGRMFSPGDTALLTLWVCSSVSCGTETRTDGPR